MNKITDHTFQKDYWERHDLDNRRPPTHPVIAEYVGSKINILKKYMPIDKETTLLDVGCGNGFFTYYWDQLCTVTGVDYSEKMLAINPVKNVRQMDANHLQFPDNSFDIVFCHALLHHVDDINSVIQEMKRVSKKYVVILEPNRNNPLMFLFSALVKEERKALTFTPKFLKNKLRENSLQAIDVFSCGMIVPNKMPAFLLPVVRHLNFRQPFGMTIFAVACKQ